VADPQPHAFAAQGPAQRIGLEQPAAGDPVHRPVGERSPLRPPDYCNHAQFGSFILAASHSPLHGEVPGARLLDIAPTLLELGGYDVPGSMQGRSLVTAGRVAPDLTADQEQIIKDRLSGLGYP